MRNKNILLISSKIILSFLILWGLLVILITFFGKRQENPAERNYIVFRHNSIDDVRDSLHNMQTLVREMALPSPPLIKNSVYFAWEDSLFEINDRKIGKLDFEILKNDSLFKNYDKYTLHRFINLLTYLIKNDITGVHYYWKSDYISYNYKEYYDMYKTYRYDDHLTRFLVIEKPTAFDLNYRSLLDSTSGLYLLSFKNARIWADSIPYMKYEERNLD